MVYGGGFIVWALLSSDGGVEEQSLGLERGSWRGPALLSGVGLSLYGCAYYLHIVMCKGQLLGVERGSWRTGEREHRASGATFVYDRWGGACNMGFGR